jgi:integrase
MLNLAVQEGHLHGRNPCQLKGAGQNPPSERPYFTIDQVDAVIDRLRDDMRPLARLTFHAHLRLSEVIALRWGQIDLRRGTVEVSRAIMEAYGEIHEVAPKSGRPRVIQLDAQARQDLIAYALGRNRLPTERVFSQPNGEDLRRHHVQSAWRAARRRAGEAALRFHDLRHVGLTMLAEAGLPTKSIMHRAGHSTVNAALGYQHRAESRGEIEAELFEQQRRLRREVYDGPLSGAADTVNTPSSGAG